MKKTTEATPKSHNRTHTSTTTRPKNTCGLKATSGIRAGWDCGAGPEEGGHLVGLDLKQPVCYW